MNKDADSDRQDLSSAHAASLHISSATTLDPSIFDYDSFHAAKSSVADAKQAAAKQDAIARKPKYIDALLDSAARRKRDQTLAKEKAVLREREREEEGGEFEGGEKFVTGAYKAQREESRRLEEEERRKGEVEEERRRKMGGGMQGFYKGVMEERDRVHQEALEAAERMKKEGLVEGEARREKTDRELAAESREKGRDVVVNEEGAIVDKRELLSAGLNITPSSNNTANGKGAADHLRSSARPTHSAFAGRDGGGKAAQRERQSQMVEEQLAAQAKRAREEEEEERGRLERAAKSTKTEGDVSDAKARFLARKAARERGES